MMLENIQKVGENTMAFKKNANTDNDVFVLTLPLDPTKLQYTLLEKYFRAGLMVEHQLMEKELKKLEQVERLRAWRNLKQEIATIYQEKGLSDNDRKAKLKPLFVQKNDILAKYGVTKAAFEHDVHRIHVYGDKVNNKGKHTSKKRFGKSIAHRAPASFVNALSRKIQSLGGAFYEIDTTKAKASQYDHMDHTYKKKKLSQRWNYLPNGDSIQRDLYSAFLIQNTNATLDGFEQSLLDNKYEVFKLNHDKEIIRLSFMNTPSSTGVKRAG